MGSQKPRCLRTSSSADFTLFSATTTSGRSPTARDTRACSSGSGAAATVGAGAVDGDLAVDVEIRAQPAHGVLAILLRGGELALRGLDRRLGAEDVDLRHLAGLVERLGLGAPLLGKLDVLLLDVDARVGVDDAEVVRRDAQEHGVLRAEDSLLCVGDAELRLLVCAPLAVAGVDRLREDDAVVPVVARQDDGAVRAAGVERDFLGVADRATGGLHVRQDRRQHQLAVLLLHLHLGARALHGIVDLQRAVERLPQRQVRLRGGGRRREGEDPEDSFHLRMPPRIGSARKSPSRSEDADSDSTRSRITALLPSMMNNASRRGSVTPISPRSMARCRTSATRCTRVWYCGWQVRFWRRCCCALPSGKRIDMYRRKNSRFSPKKSQTAASMARNFCGNGTSRSRAASTRACSCIIALSNVFSTSSSRSRK